MDINQERPKRGRPKIVVRWPDGRFTFKELTSVNGACASLLRRRVREGVRTGEVLRVSSAQLARTGRPETIYKKATSSELYADVETQTNTSNTAEEWTLNQQESTGTPTL